MSTLSPSTVSARRTIATIIMCALAGISPSRGTNAAHKDPQLSKVATPKAADDAASAACAASDSFACVRTQAAALARKVALPEAYQPRPGLRPNMTRRDGDFPYSQGLTSHVDGGACAGAAITFLDLARRRVIPACHLAADSTQSWCEPKLPSSKTDRSSLSEWIEFFRSSSDTIQYQYEALSVASDPHGNGRIIMTLTDSGWAAEDPVIVDGGAAMVTDKIVATGVPSYYVIHFTSPGFSHSHVAAIAIVGGVYYVMDANRGIRRTESRTAFEADMQQQISLTETKSGKKRKFWHWLGARQVFLIQVVPSR